MNEIESFLVKEYHFVNPLIQKIDSLIDNSIGGCHKKYFHKFIYRLVYDIKFTKISRKGKKNSQFLIKSWVCMD